MNHFLIVAALALVAQPAQAASRTTAKAVRIGTGGAELAGCTSVGEVTSATLNVRSGPSTMSASRGRLKAGDEVFICEQKDGSAWLGIVYGAKGVNCGTTDPVPAPRPYVGRCRSGWVAEKHIKYVAG